VKPDRPGKHKGESPEAVQVPDQHGEISRILRLASSAVEARDCGANASQTGF
jgi:hypothetical protein